MSYSTSNSTSSSQGTSSSFIPTYQEEPFLNAIAAYAGQAGQNIYNWAQGEYAKNSNLTDANIHNYLNTASQSSLMAQNDYNRYRDRFQPEEDQLLQDANEYASPARVALEMGQAESGQMQGNEAALANHKRDLQSYGIDPSSGRYAGLDEAARVSGAANAVGAAQQARQNTEAVGRQLRGEAIQVGSQYPGRIINAMNTALQGYAGAENAGLANANTGVALQQAANPYLATASSLKYPPLGNSSQNTSDSRSASNSVGDGSGGGSNGGKTNAPPNPREPSGGGGGSRGGGSGGGYSGGSGASSEWSSPPETGGEVGNWYDNLGLNGPGNTDFENGSGSDYSGLGLSDWTGGGGFNDWSGSTFSPSDASDFTDFSDSGMGQQDAYNDYGAGDSFSAYAEGGAIPDDDDGGEVPEDASPSGGAMTDDVPAQHTSTGQPINLNANEFVIPRDVALWKGQEFFQNLITKSRQARMGAPAKPTFG